MSKTSRPDRGGFNGDDQNPLDHASPLITQAISSKNLKTRLRYKKLLSTLEDLANIDLFAEAKLKHYWSRCCMLIAGAFICLVISFFHQSLMVLWLILIVFFGVGAFYFYRLTVPFKSQNLENEFRELVLPILKVLRHDISPSAKVDIKMPLNSIEDDLFKSNVQDLGWVGSYDVTVSTYHRPFLSLNVTLKDGNQLAILGFETLLVKDKRGRKHKVKRKAKFQITSQILCDSRYQLNCQPSQFEHKGQKIKVGLKNGCPDLKSKVVFSKPEDQMTSVKNVLRSIVRLYSYINLKGN